MIRFAAVLPLFPALLVAQSRPADLIVTNAVVYTADSARPHAEALAVPATKRIDAGGHPLYPGFIDAHAHLRNLSLILATLDLRGVPSYDSLVALVAAKASSSTR